MTRMQLSGREDWVWHFSESLTYGCIILAHLTFGIMYGLSIQAITLNTDISSLEVVTGLIDSIQHDAEKISSVFFKFEANAGMSTMLIAHLKKSLRVMACTCLFHGRRLSLTKLYEMSSIGLPILVLKGVRHDQEVPRIVMMNGEMYQARLPEHCRTCRRKSL